MNEKNGPTTINDLLGGGKIPTGERIDDYSPIELLALDEPKYEILNNGQSELFPKIVYDFFKQENRNAKDWTRFLGYFNLGIGVYDKDSNTTGMLSAEISTKKMDFEDDPDLRAVVQAGFLLLCGVNNELMTGFFGSKSFKSGEKNRFSEVFLQRLEVIRQTRAEYPLKHPEEFPKIAKAFKTIKKNLDIDPLEIFTNRHIPPLNGNKKSRSLYDILQLVSMASTGSWTKANLARRFNFANNHIYKLLNGKTLTFSEKTRNALKGKI